MSENRNRMIECSSIRQHRQFTFQDHISSIYQSWLASCQNSIHRLRFFFFFEKISADFRYLFRLVAFRSPCVQKKIAPRYRSGPVKLKSSFRRLGEVTRLESHCVLLFLFTAHILYEARV